MAPLALEMVRDIAEETVDFQDNYDGQTQEPKVLPARFANLLVNAQSHGAPPVTVSASRADGELVVTVEDRGPGIAPEDLGSIFDRFTRGVNAAGEGAGLGLSIAQSYTRAHGGTLAYEPAQPAGARFRVTLPG